MTLSTTDALPPEVIQVTVRQITNINDQPAAEVIEVIDNLKNKKVAVQNILSVKEALQQKTSVAFSSVLTAAQTKTLLTAHAKELAQQELLIADCKEKQAALNETLEQLGVILTATQQEQEDLLTPFLDIRMANQELLEGWTKWEAEMADFHSLFEEVTKLKAP